jgi:hypothetical protein
VYSVWTAGDRLVVEPRAAAALIDGMPARWLPSPLAGLRGPQPKSGPPSAFDVVRRPGVATLLTDAAGTEIFEACVAAVLAWDGRGFVRVPHERPHVASVALMALEEQLGLRVGAIAVAGEAPLVLVNAVKGSCVVDVPDRAALPAAGRRLIDEVIAASTLRP